MSQQQQSQQKSIQLNNQFTIKDTATEKTTRSCSQLEIDNAYLKQQNELLTKELSFTRYTISALKNITNQKDVTLNETRLELERALQHIQLLTFTLRQQQRLSGIDNDLASTSSSSSDEVTSEEEEEEVYPPQVTNSSRPTMDIMSKLPLRHPHPSVNNEIFIQDNY